MTKVDREDRRSSNDNKYKRKFQQDRFDRRDFRDKERDRDVRDMRYSIKRPKYNLMTSIPSTPSNQYYQIPLNQSHHHYPYYNQYHHHQNQPYQQPFVYIPKPNSTIEIIPKYKEKEKNKKLLITINTKKDKNKKNDKDDKNDKDEKDKKDIDNKDNNNDDNRLQWNHLLNLCILLEEFIELPLVIDMMTSHIKKMMPFLLYFSSDSQLLHPHPRNISNLMSYILRQLPCLKRLSYHLRKFANHFLVEIPTSDSIDTQVYHIRNIIEYLLPFCDNEQLQRELLYRKTRKSFQVITSPSDLSHLYTLPPISSSLVSIQYPIKMNQCLHPILMIRMIVMIVMIVMMVMIMTKMMIKIMIK